MLTLPSPGSRQSVLWMAQTGFRHQMANSQDMTVLIRSGGVLVVVITAWILCSSVDASLYR